MMEIDSHADTSSIDLKSIALLPAMDNLIVPEDSNGILPEITSPAESVEEFHDAVDELKDVANKPNGENGHNGYHETADEPMEVDDDSLLENNKTVIENKLADETTEPAVEVVEESVNSDCADNVAPNTEDLDLEKMLDKIEDELELPKTSDETSDSELKQVGSQSSMTSEDEIGKLEVTVEEENEDDESSLGFGLDVMDEMMASVVESIDQEKKQKVAMDLADTETEPEETEKTEAETLALEDTDVQESISEEPVADDCDDFLKELDSAIADDYDQEKEKAKNGEVEEAKESTEEIELIEDTKKSEDNEVEVKESTKEIELIEDTKKLEDNGVEVKESIEDIDLTEDPKKSEDNEVEEEEVKDFTEEIDLIENSKKSEDTEMIQADKKEKDLEDTEEIKKNEEDTNEVESEQQNEESKTQDEVSVELKETEPDNEESSEDLKEDDKSDEIIEIKDQRIEQSEEPVTIEDLSEDMPSVVESDVNETEKMEVEESPETTTTEKEIPLIDDDSTTTGNDVEPLSEQSAKSPSDRDLIDDDNAVDAKISESVDNSNDGQEADDEATSTNDKQTADNEDEDLLEMCEVQTITRSRTSDVEEESNDVEDNHFLELQEALEEEEAAKAVEVKEKEPSEQVSDILNDILKKVVASQEAGEGTSSKCIEVNDASVVSDDDNDEAPPAKKRRSSVTVERKQDSEELSMLGSLLTGKPTAKRAKSPQPNDEDNTKRLRLSVDTDSSMDSATAQEKVTDEEKEKPKVSTIAEEEDVKSKEPKVYTKMSDCVFEPEYEVKPRRQVPLDFLKTFKKSFQKMTRSDLEQLVLQKVVEAVVHKSEYSDLRVKVDGQENLIRSFRAKVSELTKQFRDLEMVHEKVIKDLESRNEGIVIPMKITRAVGLQVTQPRFGPGMKNAPPQPAATTSGAVQKSPQQKAPTAQVALQADRNAQQRALQLQQQQQQQRPAGRVGRPPSRTSSSTSPGTSEQPQLKKKFTPMRPPLTASQHQQLEHQKKVQEQQLLAQQKLKLHERQQQQQQQLQQQQQRLQQLHMQRQQLQQQTGGAAKPVILNNVPVQKLPNNATEARTQSILLKKNPQLQNASNRQSPVNSTSPSQSPNSVASPASSPSGAAPNKSFIDLTDEEDSVRRPNNTTVNQGTNPPALVSLQQKNAAAGKVTYVLSPQQLNAGASAPGGITQRVTVQQPQLRVRAGLTAQFRPGAQVPRFAQQNQFGGRGAGPQAVRRPIMAGAQKPIHPAPPPLPHNQASHPSWKRSPPRPSIRINNIATGIVISWTLDELCVDHAEVVSYQIYAYQETSAPPAADMWRHVGDVKAMLLPMAVTLTQFQEGQRYHFVVRAVDEHGRVGVFSVPRTWSELR